MTGSFSDAVETASEILNIRGTVIPATLDNIRLKMEWPNASITLHGERVIDANYFRNDPRLATLSLVPEATANPMAVQAIMEADMVVIAPGDLYTSLGPLLVMSDIGKALQSTPATVIYVANLVTKHGQTDGFSVSDHAAEIERFAGFEVIDYVLYNQQIPSRELAQRYREIEDAYAVNVDMEVLNDKHYKAVGGDFLSDMAVSHHADKLPVTRSLIRHDPHLVANAIIELYDYARNNR